jgi:thiamine biosynthesis lipoprotein
MTAAAVPVMGTVASLAAWGATAPAAVATAAEELVRLEGLWSRFRPGSDVCRLNAAAGAWVRVAPETAALLAACGEFGEESAGAFDVTLGSGGRGAIDVRGDAVRLPEGASLDLGGIGKGAAVTRVVELLRAHDVPAALVSLGRSSIGVLGPPPGGGPWRIAITRPAGEWTGTWPVLELSSGYLSTSGDYEWSSAAGNHIVDPATGRPAASGIRSATVVCADGARAEALSTAMLVLGRDAGLALHARLGGFDAVLLDEAGAVHATPGLRHDEQKEDACA